MKGFISTEYFLSEECLFSHQLLAFGHKHTDKEIQTFIILFFTYPARDCCCRCCNGGRCLLAALTASSQKLSPLLSSPLSSSSSSMNDGCGGLDGDVPQMFPDLFPAPQVGDNEPPAFPHTDELRGL